MQITSLNHFSFDVSDLDKSISFYETFLGMTLLNRSFRDPEFSSKATGICNVILEIAYLKTTNCKLELIKYLTEDSKVGGETKPMAKLAHLCLNVQQLLSF